MGVREDKKELREKYKDVRANLTKEQKAELDEKVCHSFVNSLSYKHSKSIIIYVSREDEVGTFAIIHKAFEDNKRVAVPLCVPKTFALEFYEIKSLSDLENGHYNILEPNKNKCVKSDPFTFDICVVPGVCFDFEGYRIGFGKGYYDRFLENFKGIKAGLSYSFLMQKRLPRGRFDKNIEIIATEKGVRRLASV